MACDLVLEDRPLISTDVAISAHVDLVPTPAAAPRGRMFVREHLENVLPSSVLSDVLLLTSELVTNAVLHARTDVHLGVTYDENNVLVSIKDQSVATPQPRARNAEGLAQLAESGRGMTLIAAIADDFGWARLSAPPGKVMWFTVAIPAKPDISGEDNV